MADASGRLVEDPTLFVPDNLMQTSMQHGSVCFATDGDGLWVERPDGTVENFTMSNSSLPGDALYSLHTDSSENLWIGTYRRGMALFSPRLNQFAFANTQNGKIPYDIVTAVLPVGNTIYLGLDGRRFCNLRSRKRHIAQLHHTQLRYAGQQRGSPMHRRPSDMDGRLHQRARILQPINRRIPNIPAARFARARQ